MDGTTFVFICFIISSIFLVIGIIYICRGYKLNEEGKRNLAYIQVGWIIIGVVSVIQTIGLFVLMWFSGGGFPLLIILVVPLMVLTALIFTLAFGIYNLALGFKRDKNGHFNASKITTGWVCIGINLTVVAAVITLLLMFMTGIIPIRLM